jgi:hypothetical protein
VKCYLNFKSFKGIVLDGFRRHFGLLFDNKNSSDYKIVCKDKEYFVHKTVLSARSSVFSDIIWRIRKKRKQSSKQISV